MGGKTAEAEAEADGDAGVEVEVAADAETVGSCPLRLYNNAGVAAGH